MTEATPRVSWKVEEYAYREKGPDWYWALGVIALTGATIAVIYHDYLFSVFIVLASIILGIFATRKPDLLDVAINEEGITVRNYFYPFTKIKSFGVEEHVLGSFLLIETDRIVMPVVSIPLPDTLEPKALAELLKTKVPEKPLKQAVSHRVMEHLGF